MLALLLCLYYHLRTHDIGDTKMTLPTRLEPSTLAGYIMGLDAKFGLGVQTIAQGLRSKNRALVDQGGKIALEVYPKAQEVLWKAHDALQRTEEELAELKSRRRCGDRVVDRIYDFGNCLNAHKGQALQVSLLVSLSVLCYFTKSP